MEIMCQIIFGDIKMARASKLLIDAANDCVMVRGNLSMESHRKVSRS